MAFTLRDVPFPDDPLAIREAVRKELLSNYRRTCEYFSPPLWVAGYKLPLCDTYTQLKMAVDNPAESKPAAYRNLTVIIMQIDMSGDCAMTFQVRIYSLIFFSTLLVECSGNN